MSTNTTNYCYECGRPIHNSYTIINGEKFCAICAYKFTQNNQQLGWKCPVCGKGNSPYTKQCDCISTPVKPPLYQ